MAFAYKGEEIHDEDGNLYATFAEDVYLGEPIFMHQLSFAASPPGPDDFVPTFVIDWLEKRSKQLSTVKH